MSFNETPLHAIMTNTCTQKIGILDVEASKTKSKGNILIPAKLEYKKSIVDQNFERGAKMI